MRMEQLACVNTQHTTVIGTDNVPIILLSLHQPLINRKGLFGYLVFKTLFE